MNSTYESTDVLSTPFEGFYFEPVKENFPVKPHWHYFGEIIYILKGEAKITADEKQYTIRENEMALFHPNTVHGISSDDPKGLYYAVLKYDINRLTITSRYAPKLRSIFAGAKRQGMKIVFDKEFTAEIDAENIFRHCINEIHTQSYGFDLMIRAEIYRLSTNIIRKWMEEGFTINEELFRLDETNDIYNITDYIDSQKGNITVSDIAKHCKMSYSNFARYFAAVYKMSCKEYIERVRVSRVKDMLDFTDFDLNYISQETGYSDCSHMIRTFKNLNGITPKQYRKSKSEKGG